MSNFAVLDLAYTHYDAGIYICVKTDVPCHLTLYHTTSAPRRHRTSRNQRGLTLPWGVYFCFVSWTAVEQEQEGDTIYHLFNVYPWMVLTTKWFAFRGTINGELSPSVSALFEHKHPGGFPMEFALRPHAAGDLTEIWAQIPTTGQHWDKVDDVTPDDDDTYVWMPPYSEAKKRDLYQIGTGLPGIGKIEKVTFSIRIKAAGYYIYLIPPSILLVTHGLLWEKEYPGTWSFWRTLSWEWPLNPVTNAPWTQDEFTTLQAGVALRANWGYLRDAAGYCTQVYATINRGIVCPP